MRLVILGRPVVGSDRPIAEISLDRTQQASAEVVGEREVLIRGKALGEARLTIAAKDGRTNMYRVVVQAESAQSVWGSLNTR